MFNDIVFSQPDIFGGKKQLIPIKILNANFSNVVLWCMGGGSARQDDVTTVCGHICQDRVQGCNCIAWPSHRPLPCQERSCSVQLIRLNEYELFQYFIFISEVNF